MRSLKEKIRVIPSTKKIFKQLRGAVRKHAKKAAGAENVETVGSLKLNARVECLRVAVLNAFRSQPYEMKRSMYAEVINRMDAAREQASLRDGLDRAYLLLPCAL